MTNNKIEILNGGYVRLVDHMGSDLSVVRSARVSYDADWRPSPGVNRDTTSNEFMTDLPSPDVKLIQYLIKNHHTSPFESVTFTFEVKAPIFVFRQWHRHRTWSYNEVSARYTELDMGYYLPEVAKITTQSVNNKQQRTITVHPEAEWMQKQMYYSITRSYRDYIRLLRKGCPRELARIVLPVAIYSKMFATVNLHNLLNNFMVLRDHDHAQYEVRVYAQAMKELITPIVPVTISAFNELHA